MPTSEYYKNTQVSFLKSFNRKKKIKSINCLTDFEIEYSKMCQENQKIQTFNKNTNPQTKKRVSFSCDVGVKYIRSNREYSQDERHDTWFNKADYLRMGQMSDRVLDIAREFGNNHAELLHCVEEYTQLGAVQTAQECLNRWTQVFRACRGLEFESSPDGGQQRSKEITQLINAVLIAQDTLRKTRNSDKPQVLANISAKYSEKARCFARMMGFADAKAIAVRAEYSKSPPTVPLTSRKKSSFDSDNNKKDISGGLLVDFVERRQYSRITAGISA